MLKHAFDLDRDRGRMIATRNRRDEEGRADGNKIYGLLLRKHGGIRVEETAQ